jgi:hypothetical protein
MKRLALALAAAALLQGHAALATTELQFWHSMTGASGDEIKELASRFNASQPNYRVIPVFKGAYEESLAAGIAAIRARNAPHIIQVFDAGTATMMTARAAVKPLYQLMAEAGEKLDARAYMPAVSSYYADSSGRLMSLPFNSSTAVLFYNKDAFRKAGIDPDLAPKTWRDVQAAALKVRDSEAAPCAYTTDWQSWILVESLSAWHNEPLSTRNNGFGGADAKLNFKGELLVQFLARPGACENDSHAPGGRDKRLPAVAGQDGCQSVLLRKPSGKVHDPDRLTHVEQQDLAGAVVGRDQSRRLNHKRSRFGNGHEIPGHARVSDRQRTAVGELARPCIQNAAGRTQHVAEPHD